VIGWAIGVETSLLTNIAVARE